MTTFVPKERAGQTQSQSYCLNLDCHHPENQAEAPVCVSCGFNLLLKNRYRALRPIGQGGFGRTFLAVDEAQPSRPYCVIKQFFPQPQSSSNLEKAGELFRQEAERLEALGNHAQIPKLLDYFEQQGDRPTPAQYLVQEFIDGRNLAQELTREGAFTELKIRQLLDDLLPVMKFIHSHQVIHRDIKPENIIRRRSDGRLVLVDFGSAKHATETKLAKTGTMIGSAAYTAPEQVRGKAIFASDLYSLGVTCIHLLTQVPPFDLFDSNNHAWIWRSYLGLLPDQKPRKSPSPSKTLISDRIGYVLDKMLQSATNQRFQTADEVLQVLNAKSVPKPPTKFKHKWLVAGTVLVLGVAGARTLVAPFTYQVSPTNPPRAIEVPQAARDVPDVGGLYGETKNGQQVFPLKHTEVMARVAGNVSRVEVTQTFVNPFKQPLEATYVFPLPDDAAVDDMEIQVGDRIVRGVIKKREEAQQIFQQAKQEGKTAGLLEQERDNIFTQSLANIKPGEQIKVVIRYTESLKFAKGDYEFVFPMVVGPRYIPGNTPGAKGVRGVADAARITPPALPSNRPGQDIGVTVEIEAGVPVQNVRSLSHKIHTTQEGRILRVELDKQDSIPNKDLILRYQVAGNQTQTTVLTQADERGGHFATYLIPAVKYQANQIVPKDVVFLMDTSGSQSGDPLEQSKQLMRRFIQGLNPNDTFTIIDFSDVTTQLSDKPLPNTPENRKKAIAYVNRLQANGGTELMRGIQAVMQFPPAPAGRLRSIVLLTDGYIGNDEQVIGTVRQNLKPGNRLYSFGVGSSVNRFLIDRLAELGRGTAEVVRHDQPIQEVTEKFAQQINNPVLTNIEVKWQGSGKAPDIYPLKPTDLFANQPLVLFGRKGDRTQGQLQITGIAAGGQRYEQTIPVNFTGGSNPSIAQLWGRARIKDFMDQMYNAETASGIKAVTQTALDYRLLSKYTAFVAVTPEVRVNPQAKGQTLQVPVATPEGMNNPAANNLIPAQNVVANNALNQNTTEVPEPGQIIGSLAAVMLLGSRFAWKQLRRSRTPI